MKIPHLPIITIFLTSTLCACGGSNSVSKAEPVTTNATAPTINLSEKNYIKRLDNFKLTAKAFDENNDIKSYFWQQTTGPEIANILNDNALNTQVNFPKIAGKYTFKLTVTDSQNLSSNKSIEVTVTNTALLDWYDCNLPSIENKKTGEECLHQKVPLQWQNSSSTQIENLIVRYLAPQQPAKGKIWILDGGPGGNAKWAMREEIQQKFNANEWDIYIPIHRGVEGPNKLNCSNKINFPSLQCFNELQMQYDSNLAAFNTENAAYDLADIIGKVSEAGEKDIVFGASYGTFLAQKYLQQHTEFFGEDQIDGMILDSSAPLDFQSINMGINYDFIGARVLNLCDENVFCHQQLGGDAKLFLEQTYNKLSLGECFFDEGKTMPVTVNFAKSLLDSAVTEYIDIVPGIIKMLNRCSYNDQKALRYVQPLLNESQTLSSAPFSTSDNLLVTATINSTNMFRPTMSKLEYEQHINQLKFTNLDNQVFFELAKIWPLEAQPLKTTLPVTSIPLLLLNGGLDPQSTDIMTQKVFNNYAGNQKKLVVFPGFSHGVILKNNIEEPHCVANIIQKFIANSDQELDSQCAAKTLPVDVAVKNDHTKNIFDSFFGTSSPW
ncbi:alpha/beta fold hydrolase [Pseudoalteromonas denitrificans]|uniref:Alpha/beta hydrolase fold n=1 Tax=Pseudoalteromonas denitrificans DSM 6059 TaxID=1123010 RepID=A0A1I1KD50_9GAMM|nr:alpha/beta fold hydrolase [Pseudoalteromonas denitrificans]SFC58706.1 alpha/beta hydrolase fold [Pseudoalteromonas denitrificans DSM 6059]